MQRYVLIRNTNSKLFKGQLITLLFAYINMRADKINKEVQSSLLCPLQRNVYKYWMSVPLHWYQQKLILQLPSCYISRDLINTLYVDIWTDVRAILMPHDYNFKYVFKQFLEYLRTLFVWLVLETSCTLPFTFQAQSYACNHVIGHYLNWKSRLSDGVNARTVCSFLKSSNTSRN